MIRDQQKCPKSCYLWRERQSFGDFELSGDTTHEFTPPIKVDGLIS